MTWLHLPQHPFPPLAGGWSPTAAIGRPTGKGTRGPAHINHEIPPCVQHTDKVTPEKKEAAGKCRGKDVEARWTAVPQRPRLVLPPSTGDPSTSHGARPTLLPQREDTKEPPLSPVGPAPLPAVVGRSGVAAGAEVLGHQRPALLAAHGAAPLEPAVAAGHHLGPALLHAQPALGAEPPAAPLLPLRQVPAALQALAALGALVAQAGVPGAVVGGVLQEDELGGVDVVEGLGRGPAALGAVAGSQAPLVHLQLLRLVVLELQQVAHLAELCQLQPAGLDAAAARHPVALAGSLHRVFHRLGGMR